MPCPIMNIPGTTSMLLKANYFDLRAGSCLQACLGGMREEYKPGVLSPKFSVVCFADGGFRLADGEVTGWRVQPLIAAMSK